MVHLPGWLSWALAEHANNVKELVGSEHNPRILEYFKATSLKASEDETSWCSAAVNYAFWECGLKGSGLANARSWLTWGSEITFRLGAVAVFWREDPKSWKGHVGFALAEYDDQVTLLSPNDGNRWRIKMYHKVQLLGYRWPKVLP